MTALVLAHGGAAAMVPVLGDAEGPEWWMAMTVAAALALEDDKEWD